MRSEELDFHLPPELIAQEPLPDRSASRLLHYRRCDGHVAHRSFCDLPQILRPGDLLVFNDAQVIPARFTLCKPTGGLIEGLFLAQSSEGIWTVMLKNLGGRAEGKRLVFADAPQVEVQVIEQLPEGHYRLGVDSRVSAVELLAQIGRMPLPPYIRRGREHDQRDRADRQRYQTVYARTPGSVAAPTAGLHFTPHLMQRLAEMGVERTFVTLHVGMGTFKPVSADELSSHVMHGEAYSISPEAVEALNRAKSAGHRIVAVGTTAARVLESQPAELPFAARQATTDIFIYPPYQPRHIGALITNFHLPRSTLIALVAALVGLQQQRCLYSGAIEQRYRFFSYGDAMLIE